MPAPTLRIIGYCETNGAEQEDERPGDYLEQAAAARRIMDKRHDALSALASYPAPIPADLVSFWPRNGLAVLSVTADGKTTDYELPARSVAHLAREAIDWLEGRGCA